MHARAVLVALLALPSAVAESAFADEFQPVLRPGFQLRVDATSTDTDKGGKDNTTEGFLIYRARMAVGGDLDENTSFFVREDVMYPYDTPSDVETDQAVSNLERAYIEHRPLPGLALRFGRFPLMTGSIEWDYSSLDQYVTSHLNDELNFPIFPPDSGVDATYKLGSQSLTVQALNGLAGLTNPSAGTPAPKADAGTQKGENLTTSVGFRGNYFDGVLKPILSYNSFSRIRNGDGTVRDDKETYTAYAGGAQISAFHFDLDLEGDSFVMPAYTYYSWDSNNKATAVHAQKDALQSLIGQLAYNLPEAKMRFFAKYTNEMEFVGGKQSATYKRDGFGAEFRPGYKTFRYHVALIDHHDTNESGSAPVRTNVRQYIAGVAAKI